MSWTEQNVFEANQGEEFDWELYQYLCDIFDDEE